MNEETPAIELFGLTFTGPLKSDAPPPSDLATEMKALRAEVYALRANATRTFGTLLSVEDACQMIGCQRRRLFQLLRAGTLERAPRVGKSLRLTRASVEALLSHRPEKGRKRRARQATAPAQLRDIPVFKR